MLLIHAVQKLLNTSGIKASLHVGAPSEGQQLYSWYAVLAGTGLPGKLLVLYVHEPSLLTVVCQGKHNKGYYRRVQGQAASAAEASWCAGRFYTAGAGKFRLTLLREHHLSKN